MITCLTNKIKEIHVYNEFSNKLVQSLYYIYLIVTNPHNQKVETNVISPNELVLLYSLDYGGKFYFSYSIA